MAKGNEKVTDLERYRAGAEYLILLALCGREDILNAFKLYAEGRSPHDIAMALRLNEHNIKCWLNRLYVRVHPAYAPLLIKRILPYLKEVKPIAKEKTCLICNITFKTPASVVVHVLLRHRDLVHTYTKQILAKLGGADEAEGESS